tara:strand:+ start:924 stop:1652 length:729 start_codon:yes stop_codon:yes gene_type:complete
MSKQVKLKFKKMLKKAEFAQADLEYHEVLLPEAKQEFFAKAQEVLDSLPPDIQKKIHEARALKMDERAEALRRAAEANEEEEPEEEEGDAVNEVLLSEDVSDDSKQGPEIEIEDIPVPKEAEIKKMFRRIASVTHPDKLGNDISSAQERKLDKIFKRAKDAYTNGNWYVLYSISLDLGLDVPEPTKEHSDWLVEDIKLTQDRISHIGSLLVWVWYTGDEDGKKFALENYFEQVYDHTLTDLP